MVSVQQSQESGDNISLMEGNIERDCSMLGGLFQVLINDLKTSVPQWEDFQAKASKFQAQLRATVVSLTAFLESFQRLADIATGSRGATKDLGASLTRLCLRHKAMEFKLKSLCSSMQDYLVIPLQERIEDWKKNTVQLDKDHAKEYKKARQEIKKKSSDTLRLQKKARKGKTSVQYQLDSAMQEVGDMYILLEETEKTAVRKALIEERGRFCCLVNLMTPAIEEELSMLGEIVHLQSVLDELREQTKDPLDLPPASEQVILDVKGQENQFTYTPPASPTLSTGSRKSSVCGSISSMNSSDSRSSSSLTSGNSSHSAHSHPSTNQIGHHRHRSLSTPLNPAHRLSSVSSQDSGFTSQDTLFMRPGTPTSQHQQQNYAGMPVHGSHEYARQQSSGSASSSGDSTPSSSPSCQMYTAMGVGGTSSTSQPSTGTLGRRSNRPKPVPTPSVPVKLPHEKLPKLPSAHSAEDSHNFERPQLDQIVLKPKTPQENQAEDWTKRSSTLPTRRSHSVATPYDIGGTIPRSHRSTPSADLNGSHDSGYEESSQLLPPPMGFENQGADFSENPYLIPDDKSTTSQNSQTSSNSSDSIASHRQNQLPTDHSSVNPATSTPTHHRHSVSAISYREPRSEENYQNIGRSKSMMKERPPPPIRRTPSGNLGSGGNPESSEMSSRGIHTSQWDNPTYEEAKFDASGQFKVPLPIQNTSASQSSSAYDYPSSHQYQQRPPTMARSKSLTSPSEMDPNQSLARLSLLENLNAKLAERGKKQSSQPQMSETAKDVVAGEVCHNREVPPVPSVSKSPAVAWNNNRTSSTQMAENLNLKVEEQRTSNIYDYPSEMYPQSDSTADIDQILPPPPEDFGEPPPAKESTLQTAIREKSRKLKRTETMDRSAPMIPRT